MSGEDDEPFLRPLLLTSTCTVRTASIGKAARTWTVVERMVEPGPGRAEPTNEVSIAVTIPVALCMLPASVTGSTSPKAAAQACRSRVCRVRFTDAVSPSSISSKVLFTIVHRRGPPRKGE